MVSSKEIEGSQRTCLKKAHAPKGRGAGKHLRKRRSRLSRSCPKSNVKLGLTMNPPILLWTLLAPALISKSS